MYILFSKVCNIPKKISKINQLPPSHSSYHLLTLLDVTVNLDLFTYLIHSSCPICSSTNSNLAPILTVLILLINITNNFLCVPTIILLPLNSDFTLHYLLCYNEGKYYTIFLCQCHNAKLLSVEGMGETLQKKELFLVLLCFSQ